MEECALPERAWLAGARPGAVTLRMGVSHVRGTVPYWRELAKLKVRARVQYGLTRRWLVLLNSDAFLAQLAACAPHLLHKVYRPYLSTTLCAERRLQALDQHYRFVLARGMAPLVLEAARSGAMLASFSGKCGGVFQIWLCAVAPMEREGELVLQLRSGDAVIYSLAFSFVGDAERPALHVGCLQGARGTAMPELIRATTRALHGLRPKNLLTGLARQLGHDLGCGHLTLVGNANRVVASALRQGKVLADYDETWHELGAQRRADGDFDLGCRPLAEPDLEQVESKRRSELRKRHLLCKQVHEAVSARVAGAWQRT
jgi:uncharacterized protein VirK/YbjX